MHVLWAAPTNAKTTTNIKCKRKCPPNRVVVVVHWTLSYLFNVISRGFVFICLFVFQRSGRWWYYFYDAFKITWVHRIYLSLNTVLLSEWFTTIYVQSFAEKFTFSFFVENIPISFTTSFRLYNEFEMFWVEKVDIFFYRKF